MGKKKDKNKKIENMIGDMIGDDIRKEVNRFDKKFGINLKDPDVWTDSLVYRPIMEEHASANLGAILCIINGIPVSEFYDVYSDRPGDAYVQTKPIGVRNKEFTDVSKLQWNSTANHNTKSTMFRARYLSLLAGNFLGKISKLTGKMVPKNTVNRDEKRIVKTNTFMDDLTNLSMAMMSENCGFSNRLLKMFDYCNYTDKKSYDREASKLAVQYVLNFRRGVAKSLLQKEKFLSDDLAIFVALKAAYTLATGKSNASKVLPKFKEIEGATVNHDLSLLLEELGRQILLNRDSKLFPMFRAFMQARPSIKTSFYKEASENAALNMGIYAIAFVGFVCNTKESDKFIQHMLKSGI